MEFFNREILASVSRLHHIGHMQDKQTKGNTRSSRGRGAFTLTVRGPPTIKGDPRTVRIKLFIMTVDP